MFIEAYPADDQANLAGSLVDYVVANHGKRPMLFEQRLLELEAIENISLGPKRVGPSRFFAIIEIEE
jgi:hypothetical protein